MKETGQAFGVFKLAIFAIVMIALIFIVLNFFPSEEQDALKELRDSIESAQANEGHAITKTILMEEHFAIDAGKIFDTTIRSVSFQCNSTHCASKAFDVSARNFVVNEKISIQFTSRCIFEKNIYNCKIYFGTPPAQLKVFLNNLKESYNLENEKIIFLLDIKNAGKQNSVNSKAEIKVFRKEVKDGKMIENLYLSPETKPLEIISPNQTSKVEFDLPIRDSGNFLVQIRAFGEDSGEVSETVEFSAFGQFVSLDCKTSEKLETFLNETLNKCVTRYSCTGCERSFECQQKWQEQNAETVFESSSKEMALELNDPVNGLCE